MSQFLSHIQSILEVLSARVFGPREVERVLQHSSEEKGPVVFVRHETCLVTRDFGA